MEISRVRALVDDDTRRLQNRLDEEWARRWAEPAGLTALYLNFTDRSWGDELIRRLVTPPDVVVENLGYVTDEGSFFRWRRV